MFLSRLLLNATSRRVWTEISRPYELHRTLMRAFLPAQASENERILFRLDRDREEDMGAILLLVQSQEEPNWTSLETARGFLREPPQCKPFTPIFHPGQVLRFRLRANPTVKRQGKRFGLMKEEEQLGWLRRKGEVGGFAPLSVVVIPERQMEDKKTDDTGHSHDLTLTAVRFDGVLQITDLTTFNRTLEQGVGSGKGFGFGLLSVAPMR